jgi:hypothetical protein
MPEAPPRNRSVWAFAAVVAVCVLGIGGWIVASALSGSGAEQRAPAVGHRAAARSAVPPANSDMVVFRSLDRSGGAKTYGRLAWAPLADLAYPTVTPLHCDRVYFGAGRGMCLTRSDGFPAGYQAIVLDQSLKVVHKVKLGGVPSRTRISPSGNWAATTTFVSGHSYAVPGTFSTETLIIDLRSGRSLGNLEKFAISRDGKRLDKPDINIWGVTFAKDDDTFYATLATGGHTYLWKGSISRRSGTVVHENVECPSLSPDGTRIAYKKLVGKPAVWHFTVLDLATGKETPLVESRPLDDQIEWLDDGHVLYGSGEEVWTMPADGTGTPSRYLAAANSPAVVRLTAQPAAHE